VEGRGAQQALGGYIYSVRGEEEEPEHARTLAVTKPSAMSMFSQMSTRSGTMTVMGRKSALRPSGSSERPR
jgi:hypothetical protein